MTRDHNAPKTHIPPTSPPSRRLLVGEILGLKELPKLLRHWTSLKQLQPGKGQTILVLPGYATSDASTWLLRRFLTHLGYRVYGWGLGYNAGNVQHNFKRMTARIQERYHPTHTPLLLVGWSLGGTLARELARAHPDWVHYVLTMGSPVQGGPKYTFAAKRFRKAGRDLDAVEEAIKKRNETPLTVPVTALYSRKDGIVAWEACIDPWNEVVEHIEVDATHLGLGVSRDVYRLIAQKLAEYG